MSDEDDVEVAESMRAHKYTPKDLQNALREISNGCSPALTALRLLKSVHHHDSTICNVKS